MTPSGWTRRTVQGRPTDEAGQDLDAYDREHPDGSSWTIRERRRVPPYATPGERPWYVLSKTDTYGRSAFVGRKGGKTRYIDQARRFDSPRDAAAYAETKTRRSAARVAARHLRRR